MAVFIAYDPNAHGMLHMRDWISYPEPDVDGKDLQILEHQPTRLKFFIATDLDVNGKFVAYGVECQNPPFNRLEQPDLPQIAQHAIRFYCTWKKTTPEAEKRKEEDWANTRRTTVDSKTNGLVIITDEMREHVRDDFLLVFADDPKDIDDLEADCKMTQAQQVDEFIDDTCWGEELTPEQIANPDDRNLNLRAAMIKGEADPLSQLRKAKSKS